MKDKSQEYARVFDNGMNGIVINQSGENCRWSKLGREYEEPSVTCDIGDFFYVQMQVSSRQCNI